MLKAAPQPIGYIVIAEIATDEDVPKIYGEALHDTIDCAAHEVRDLAVALGLQRRGATFLGRHEGLPVGVAITADGDAWAVQMHPVAELVTRVSLPK